VHVQGAFEGAGREGDEFLGVVERTEGEPTVGFGDGCAPAPLQAQPFDRQVRAGALQDGHPAFDDPPLGGVLTPVGRDESAVFGPRHPRVENAGGGRAQERRTDPDEGGIVEGVVEIEDVQEQRCALVGVPPPGDPGGRRAGPSTSIPGGDGPRRGRRRVRG